MKVPSVDSLGRIYALMDSQPLRDTVGDIAHRLKRNKALTSHEGWYVAAVDGHEFFSSRKRCCPDCQSRTLTVDGEKVTEYYHQGAVCHLIGQELAPVLDVELLRPGEVEETTAKRLFKGVFTQYPRFFDVVAGDALYFDAPLSTSAGIIRSTSSSRPRGRTGSGCRTRPGCSPISSPVVGSIEKAQRTVHSGTRTVSPRAKG